MLRGAIVHAATGAKPRRRRASYDWRMEKVPASSPLSPYVSVDPDRLSGEPVFRGTRVPVRSLFDHLAAGETIEVFLDDFEGVSREQAVAVIDLAAQGLLGPLGKGGARAA